MNCSSTDSWLAKIVDQIPDREASEFLPLRDEVAAAMERSNIAHEGIPFCKALEPLLIEGDIYERNLEITNVVMKALRIATETVFADEKLRRALGIPPYMDAFLELDSRDGGMPLIGRFDAFVNEHGQVRGFIEYNGMPGGLNAHSELIRLFGDEAVQKTLGDLARVRRTEDMFDRLWLALHKDAQSRGLEGHLRIGVPSASPAMQLPSPEVANFAARGATVFMAARELFALDGMTLTVGGEPIDYV